jgi:hypothetical protein
MLYIYKISFELILFWFLILIFQYNTIFDIYKTLFHFSFYQYLHKLKSHFFNKKINILYKIDLYNSFLYESFIFII